MEDRKRNFHVGQDTSIHVSTSMHAYCIDIIHRYIFFVSLISIVTNSPMMYHLMTNPWPPATTILKYPRPGRWIWPLRWPRTQRCQPSKAWYIDVTNPIDQQMIHPGEMIGSCYNFIHFHKLIDDSKRVNIILKSGHTQKIWIRSGYHHLL